jgi:transposase
LHFGDVDDPNSNVSRLLREQRSFRMHAELGTDPGFHYSVLSEFRTRLLAGKAEYRLFDHLLSRFREKGLLKKRGPQRTDSTHVLGSIRMLHRVELVGETLRYALNTLAVAAPAWLLAHSLPEWVERYGPRVSDYRLPTTETQQASYLAQVGADGLVLLAAIRDETDPNWLSELPAVRALPQVWQENYIEKEGGQLRWLETSELPAAGTTVRSPYDREARYAQKRSTLWVGYKVHLTETCEAGAPRLVTHVETTVASVHDLSSLEPIHQALATKDCLPAQHLVDSGYIDAELLVSSQENYGVDLFGPTREDTGWQAREGIGFAARDFQSDGEHQQAICPAGEKSRHWLPATNNKGQTVIQVKFSKRECRACALQLHCTHSSPPRRSVTILPEAPYKALLAARQREQTVDFWKQYAARAGIEGSLSQGVRAFDLRRSRYLGLAKTHLQHLLIAMAMNISRVTHWLAGDTPAQTRQSAFVRLYASPVQPV